MQRRERVVKLEELRFGGQRLFRKVPRNLRNAPTLVLK
jgi:hypothetical protein